MPTLDSVVFVQHALDLLPTITGSFHSAQADTSGAWDELSKRAQELIQLQANEYLTEFVVVHHRDCVPLENFYSHDRKYSDSAVNGGEISAAIYYTEWWISICAAYQADDGGGSYVRQAVSELAARHGLEYATSYVERLWSTRFIIHSRTAWENLWALARAKAYGIGLAQSIEELLAAKELAGREANVSRTIPSLIAETNHKYNRNHHALIEIYHRDRTRVDQRLSEIKEAADSTSTWLAEIRVLQPHYKVLQEIAEEATLTASLGSEQDEFDTLARYVDERHADITTCLTLLRPVGLVSSMTPSSIEYLYRGRVAFPGEIRQAALSMLASTGSIDVEQLCRDFAASLSDGHRWARDIALRGQQELFRRVVSSVREQQTETKQESRTRVVSVLLSMGTAQERQALEDVLGAVLEISVARSASTAAEYLRAVTDSIMAAWAQGKRLALGAIPFVLWSLGGHVASGLSEGPETGLSTLVTPFTSAAIDSLRCGAPILARHGPQLALELQPLIAMTDQGADIPAIGVGTAIGVLIAELLKYKRRPYVIWQSWGSIFEAYRTNLTVAEHLALVSFFLMPEIFSVRDCQDLGWFDLEAMLVS
jgi:hypothetical protein